jgi:hypothetical protein
MEEVQLRNLISALYLDCTSGGLDEKMQYLPSLLSNSIYYMRLKFLDPASDSTVRFRTRLHLAVECIIENKNRIPIYDPRRVEENAEIMKFFDQYCIRMDNKDDDDVLAMELISSMERLERCKNYMYQAIDEYSYMQGSENPTHAYSMAQKLTTFIMNEMTDILLSFRVIDVSVQDFKNSKEKRMATKTI